MKRVTVLGSTGSIGTNTLDLIRRHPSRFVVHALTAYSDIQRLEGQIREFRPVYAVVVDPEAYLNLKATLERTQSRTELLQGAAALEYVAGHPETDYVMAAIVGAAGLLPTLAAAEAGKRVLLANKEALVIAGALFMETVRRKGALLLPIDSEHNAIFQCLPSPLATGKHELKYVEKILLTASGGPFRQTPLEQLGQVSVDEACAHPNWRMGRKISIDSATLMNKGLEWIEACYLFDLTPSQVEIVIHPQSLIHSMVQYTDGSVLAQMGTPDMRIPIAYALGWPERIESGSAKLDLIQAARLDFAAPDHERFPCLRLAENAIRCGGNAPAVLNAANEVAVQAFLAGQIRFIDIAAVIQFVMERLNPFPAVTVEALLAEDRKARVLALDFIQTSALEA